ncbi:hypothetical protein HEP81_06522 [Streptomyces griseofuscus]|uniref:Uncharacterized protein n=1 Tax=Streptomyces griseofuscus TaxID=146922 RepID=A0A7H1Q8X7_9ACTN|nr:hypothetical protein [Streptomyces griseofuscus]QNT96757.1 hypothetical protein HEP81_06522 [Streptomyces griseofuscus]
MSSSAEVDAVSPLRQFAVGGCSLGIAAELDMAREALAETDAANIHDVDDMIRSAVILSMRLRTLVAAVEAGEPQ